jgi:hypothetical protein
VPKPSSATPIVLAYSGSATTTAAIPWLSEQRAADVVTVTLDLGQGQELEAVRDRAIAAGAVRAHVLDVREEFAREHVLPSLQAGATDAAGHPLIAALPIPLIARKLVDIASIEQARMVAHGSLGGEGVNPLQMAIQTLGPSLVTVVPPRPAASEGILANLWGRGVVVSEADGVRDGMAPRRCRRSGVRRREFRTRRAGGAQWRHAAAGRSDHELDDAGPAPSDRPLRPPRTGRGCDGRARPQLRLPCTSRIASCSRP